MQTRILALLVILSLAMPLAACSKTAAPEASAASEVTGTAAQRQLPEVLELALGTLKLEGTDQAVTAEQAATLLPLWKAYRSLNSNQSTAPTELTSLTKQIKSAMTDDQVSAIKALGLSADSVMALMNELGISEGVVNAEAIQTRRAEASSSLPSGGAGGGPGGGPGGGGGAPPAGGGGAPAGGMMGPGGIPGQEGQTGAQAQAGGGMFSQLGSAIYDKVIEVLAAKA